MNSRQSVLSEKIKEELKTHIRLPIICDFLKAHDKATVRSWDDLFVKHQHEQVFFEDLLKNILCFGNKTLFAFYADGLDVDEIEALSSDPIAILTAVASIKTNHIFFNKESSERFSAYSFVINRPAIEVHVLSQENLTAETQKKLWTPDSTVRISTKINVATFDSLIFDKQEKLLFIAIDNKRFSFENSAYDMQSTFFNALQDVCPSFSSLKMIDFFSAIDEMYKNKSEGLVHQLSFECNTGAVRNETLKAAQLDLRDELYHTSGKKAIGGDISPFKVGITWHPSKYKNLHTEASVELNGTRKILHSKNGLLNINFNSSGSFNELCFALVRLGLYVHE